MMFSALALVAISILSYRALAATPISVSSSPPSNAPAPIPKSFVSFSIEFSSFPAFAGNSSSPNRFSYNLISNLGRIQGSNPVIRVGGNTQDYALLNFSQSAALIGIIDPTRSKDYPTTITIGPSYFDSYSTWPNTTFIHGFNLAKNGTTGMSSLLACAKLACKALTGDKLAYWELGNEPDLYKTSSQGPVRPASWDEQDYVHEWLNKSRALKTVIQETCPAMVENGKFKFIAPSFGGTTNSLDPVLTWDAGLDTDEDIAMISGHNYIGGATQPGITLSNTLLNHTATVASVSHFLANWTQPTFTSTNLPLILGETNSLYNEGKPGLSNSFGAALWGLDYNLYCASQGVRRVHMQQGDNYRYAAWQPHQTDRETLGTKAPYYGSIAVASFLGDLTRNNVTVVDLEMEGTHEAGYAAYVDGKLARIAVVQMNEYNTSTPGLMAHGKRPSETYTFQLPSGVAAAGTGMKVQRLLANGSDAISGVTFGGVSYNYELDGGRPVILKNMTVGEMVSVSQGGVMSVQVPWASAVVLTLV